jgi:hypothetical protein
MPKAFRIIACAAIIGYISEAMAQSTTEFLRRLERETTPEGLLIVQSTKELQGWSQQAEFYGLNCPLPTGLYDEGENALGVIWRLECKSRNASSSWRIRIILRDDGPARMTPW